MNRFRSGSVALFALLAVAGCSSEPTDDLRGGIDHLEARPTQLFIEVGQTKNVEVGAVDAQGNPLEFAYEVTETGPGITVRRDTTFLPIFVDDSTLQAPATAAKFRFIVEGASYTSTSFTVAAGGDSIVIPVQVIPQAGLAATFDDDTVDLGQSVTVTAPAGTTFTEDAFLTIGADTLTLLSQDATNITFIPPPSVNSPVTINGVISASAPDIVFSPATQTALVTPLIDTVDVAYSTLAPTLGQTVTLTSPDPLISLAVDSLIFPGQIPGREGDPQSIVIAPDSLSLTFVAPPNINGQATVVNFEFPGGYLRALPTLDSVVGENIGITLPATISDTAPDVSQVVTITAPAGFTFDDTTNVTVGASAAVVTSNTGGTVSIVPLPGSAGVPQIDGVVPTASPLNRLTMPAENTVIVPSEVPTLAGSEAPATAPTMPVPGVGELSVLFDNPDMVATIDHFYRIDVPAGTFSLTLDWNVGGDIDAVICSAPCDDPFGADLVGDVSDENIFTPGLGAFQGATSAHPEFVTLTLSAGTYFILAEDFGGDAAGTTLTLTLERTN
jgi:hypothetical protein